MSEFLKGKISFIQNVMAFKSTRVLLMIGFFLFIYQILYAIGVFFAVNTMVLSMWMCWLAMFVAFVSFLPVRNALFYVKTNTPTVSEKVVQGLSQALSEVLPQAVPEVTKAKVPPPGSQVVLNLAQSEGILPRPAGSSSIVRV